MSEETKALRLTKEEIHEIAMTSIEKGNYGEDLVTAQLLKAADWLQRLHDSDEGEGWLLKDAAKALTKAAGDEVRT